MYLHDSAIADEVKKITESAKLTSHIINNANNNFPVLLAKSRYFLSGFGYSFYEALHLGTYPIALPLSDLHARDARTFYQAFGLDDMTITSAVEAVEIASRASNPPSPVNLAEGNSRLPALFAELLANTAHEGL